MKNLILLLSAGMLFSCGSRTSYVKQIENPTNHDLMVIVKDTFQFPDSTIMDTFLLSRNSEVEVFLDYNYLSEMCLYKDCPGLNDQEITIYDVLKDSTYLLKDSSDWKFKVLDDKGRHKRCECRLVLSN